MGKRLLREPLFYVGTLIGTFLCVLNRMIENAIAFLRGLLARATLVPVIAEDYDHAAALYRTCRRSGETVRKLIDCLIAAVAIRSNATVLHADADFATLARHTPLALHPDPAT